MKLASNGFRTDKNGSLGIESFKRNAGDRFGLLDDLSAIDCFSKCGCAGTMDVFFLCCDVLLVSSLEPVCAL